MPTPPDTPQPAEPETTDEPARERLLRAAVAEFGAKGYSGARTAAIAARAGVNPQLIAYYFGGKQGLLDELRRRWTAREAALVPPGATFAESVAAYLDATLDQPDWARLVLWRALGDDPHQQPADQDEQAAAQRTKLRQAVVRMRRRQRDGELTGGVDAEFILLLAHLLAFAPVAMPQLVQALFGMDPYSPDYRRLCLDQLLRLVRRDGQAAHPHGAGEAHAAHAAQEGAKP